jgi:hypothetical protein
MGSKSVRPSVCVSQFQRLSGMLMKCDYSLRTVITLIHVHACTNNSFFVFSAVFFPNLSSEFGTDIDAIQYDRLL